MEGGEEVKLKQGSLRPASLNLKGKALFYSAPLILLTASTNNRKFMIP
jgi:hypothetical protein